LNKSIIFIFFLVLILTSCNSVPPNNLTSYVDPFIGTGGHGHTYPGAAWPFGMVQLSPDTRLEGWDGCGGYHYSDNIIYGFSHTHLSGTGVPDYADVLFMPTTGKINLKNGTDGDLANSYGSLFSHDNEKASPGYYSVILDDYNIKAELTVTPRTGLHKYTFPSTDQANIIIDLEHRDKVIESGIKIINDSEIEGFRRSDAWARDQHIYFVAQFSKPFNDYGLARDNIIINDVQEVDGENIKAFLTFETKNNEDILVKVGISAVSIEGARKNLEAESPDWNFDKTLSIAQQQWENMLSRISVKGNNEKDKTVFYTAMYHAFLNPNLYMDFDGKYRGTDLEIHQADDFVNYTVFSLWDTYRAEHPLLTIIDQKRTNDFIKTMIHQYENGGKLPVWELAANYTGCMIGYHSIPVIADAYLKGIDDYDVEKAFDAMKHSAEMDHLGLEFYKELGYIPAEKESESVSKTLEYAYDDWCIAQMAAALEKEEDYITYIKRAQYYKNLFDPSTRFMRARMHGFWFEPFDPKEVNFNYTEANSWQYSFYVPQDVDGLMKLMGGPENFGQKLDELFTTGSETTGRQQSDITGLIGQYAHGNEPSHHMAYLYNYIAKPWKTQEMVRQIMDEFYSDAPDGLCGNEDCGQMSAWYIMSAMGFYPVCPGQDIYVLGSPKFDHISILLETADTFNISVINNSENNIYIQSVILNNRPYNKSFITHQDIVSGGHMQIEMGSEPNKDWGANPEDLPVSAIEDHFIIPVPYIASGSHTFLDSTVVALGNADEDIDIYYAFSDIESNQDFNKYGSPLIIHKTTTIQAYAEKKEMPKSSKLFAEIFKIPEKLKIKLNTEYSGQYAAGGDLALVDHLKGGNDFRTGTWQGYHGVDLDAEIDLNEQKFIESISVGFLQDNNSWIFMPYEVNYFISDDGEKYDLIETVINHLPPQEEGSFIRYFTADIQSTARYIKVIAKNIGTCPDWHKGAGAKAWIFTDEIIINY